MPDESADGVEGKREAFSITLSPGKGTTVKATALLEAVFAALTFAGILLILQLSRAKIDTNSVLIAILPVLFWLFLSGRITAFKAFGVEIQAALDKVSKQPVGTEGTVDDTEQLEFDETVEVEKERRVRIREYISNRGSALTIRVGRRNFYNPEVLRDYIDEMLAAGTLKWVVFQNERNEFQQMISASDMKAVADSLASLNRGSNPSSLGGLESAAGYRAIIDLMEQDSVSTIPGSIGKELALKSTDTKAAALVRFSTIDADDLPVINDSRRFVGVINRGKLSSQVLSKVLLAAQKTP